MLLKESWGILSLAFSGHVSSGGSMFGLVSDMELKFCFG